MEASQYQSSRKMVEEIQQQMRRAEAAIETKMNAWYGRLAANNGISMAEAKKLLNRKELEEFRWDVNDYIKYGKENAINGQWMKQLENASARVHISRLEQLKLQVQQEAERLYGNYLDGVDRHIKTLYEEGFYKTAYEIQKGIGVGWNLTGVDSNRLDRIIRKPWAADGKNFSERIWSSKQQLIENVHTSLTQMCILGQAPDKAIASLSHAMHTSRNQAGRLIMTESAFFGAESRKDCFKNLGVEQYEIVATLDSVTSDICREMDGKVFPMSEYESGSTAPPFHVWCRTTTVPAFGDEFDHIGERAARDPDTGKTYYVPVDMKYQEWKKTFVENEADAKKVIFKMKNASDVLTRNKPPVRLQDLESKYKDSIMQVIHSAPLPFQRVILENQDRIVFAKINAMGKARYSSQNGIFINLKKDFSDSRGQWTTLFHEMGHNIDTIYGKPSEQTAFINALKNDFTVFTTGYAKYYNINVKEAYKELSNFLEKATDEESHIFSDLFDALSEGKCKGRYGHKREYWKSDKIIGSEAFAHFFSASATGNTIKLESIKEIFPNAYEEFLKVIGEIK